MHFQQEFLLHLLIIALIAIVGYLGIPGAGAFYVRHMWRKFRRTLLTSVVYPPLTYADVHETGELDATDERGGELRGPFRFYGSIRAIQGDDRAWCSDGKLTVSVNLHGKRVFLLSSSYLEKEIFSGNTYPEEPPRRVSWNSLSSLPEYTGIFISGFVSKEGGQGVFVDSEKVPLLVIIYEQEDSALLRQAIWRGRQRNEYWNVYTPGSLVVTSFVLFLYFYFLMQNPLFHLPAIAALTLCLTPLLPLLPPAVFFLFFYTHYWKRGRMLRAERDLLRLPTLFFQDGEDEEERCVLQEYLLPSREHYVMARVPDRESAEKIFPEADQLQLSLPQEFLGEAYYVFGVMGDTVSEARETEKSAEELHADGEGCTAELGRLTQPKDPAAEGLVIPGNPFRLSKLCEKRAQRLESFGLLLFAVGLALNLLITFVILGYLPL